MSDWLIYSHEHTAWWSPKRWGYTDRIAEAGLYSEEEARGICERAALGWPQGMPPKGLPPEVMVPATDATRADWWTAVADATQVAIDIREAVTTR